MKKGLIICLIILVLVTGCIKVKNPNCPASGNPTIDIVGAATVTNIGQPVDSSEPLVPTSTPTDSTPSNDNAIIKEVIAGELVNFPNLNAEDPDGQTISYTFTKPLNKKGEWLTTEQDVGEYLVTITISDGEQTSSQEVLIKVLPKNNPPIIEAPEKISIQSGDTLEIPLKVSDKEDDRVSVKYEGWISSLPYKVKANDVGVHIIKIIANDGNQDTTHEVQVTVTKSNTPPVIEKIEDIIINETSKITINPKYSDADGDELKVIYSAPLHEDGTWTPTDANVGKHEVFITVSDGKDQTSTSFFIIVESKNKPPKITGVKDLTVKEGDLVSLDIDAFDPEGEEVKMQVSGYMNDTTKEIGYDDAGVHTVRVTVTDGVKSSTATFLITVEEVNRAPVFTPDAFN